MPHRVRGVVVDASTSGNGTTVTAAQTLPVTVAPDADQTFAAVVKCVTEHNAPMSYGEIAKTLGCSKTWIAKVVKANEQQWDDLRDRIGGTWP